MNCRLLFPPIFPQFYMFSDYLTKQHRQHQNISGFLVAVPLYDTPRPFRGLTKLHLKTMKQKHREQFLIILPSAIERQKDHNSAFAFSLLQKVIWNHREPAMDIHRPEYYMF